jgi:2'-5' RNA ligase
LTDLRRSGAALKVVRPEILHVTLKFLGDTDEELVDQIFSSMEKAVQEVHPFTVRLVGMGAFPSLSNIRVVWVGMEDGGELSGIARKLDSSLSELGFQQDQKGFKPHLTIARARGSERMGAVQAVLRERAASDFGTYKIGSIRLKKSVLGPKGPTYSNLRETMLE